jgi:5-methylcytosine-specific restriction endonuclease McrA
VRACDIDHAVQRQAGGSHTRDNLVLLCRHHHRAKDEGGYRLRQHEHGHLEWTTPLGHTYRTDPESTV